MSIKSDWNQNEFHRLRMLRKEIYILMLKNNCGTIREIITITKYNLPFLYLNYGH